MSEGFGNLAGLQKLDMWDCRSLGSLPNSESRHSESFYFLIFDVRRLWTVVVSDQRCFLAGFNQLRSLTSLNLDNCPAKGGMPPALKEQLNAQGCGI